MKPHSHFKDCNIKWTLFSLVMMLTCFSNSRAINSNSSISSKNGRFISLFQVVKFPNDPCLGSGSRNGTCYTSTECSNLKGTSVGPCAAGYGVCCSFFISCGESSSQNGTYFESNSASPNGECPAKLCKASSNICQIRLDFISFVISGPSTQSTSLIKQVGGQVDGGTGSTSVSTASQCLTDSFVVTGGSTSQISALCGKLSGEHIYLEADTSCITLTLFLGPVGIDTAIAKRSWQIKISQYNCEFTNRAPTGCLQYFYGQTTGTFKTFNFDGIPKQHLANQQQSVCIRREKNNCRICYYAEMNTDFQVSGDSKATKEGLAGVFECCAYKTNSFRDCVMIPGASAKATEGKMISPSICGKSLGLVTTNAGTATPASICSSKVPFKTTFISDNWENTDGTNLVQSAGFKLNFEQFKC